MIKDYSEEVLEEKVFLTETEVAPILEMLLKHQRLHVEFPSIEYSFEASTVMKILKMASLVPEEAIRFTLRQRAPTKRSNRRPSIKEIRDAKRKLKIDTDDELVLTPLLIPDIHQEKHSLFTSDTPKEDNSNPEPFVIKSDDEDNEQNELIEKSANVKYNGAIGKNLTLYFVIWTLLYLLLLVLGVFFGRHVANFYTFSQLRLSVYVICDIIVCILSILCGTTGMIILIMIYFNKEKIERYSTIQRLNPMLITSIVVSFALFFYMNYLISDIEVQLYIQNTSSFVYILISLIINQTACLLFNLKMDHFTQEWQRMNGLAMPLLE